MDHIDAAKQGLYPSHAMEHALQTLLELGGMELKLYKADLEYVTSVNDPDEVEATQNCITRLEAFLGMAERLYHDYYENA
jgi:hypothetical protein